MSTVTLEEIWSLFKETDRLMKEQSQETARRSQELSRLSQETDRKFQETERFMKQQAEEAARRSQELSRLSQETDRKFQETERFMKQQAEEASKRSQETDRKFQETDRRFQETERFLKQQSEALNRKIGQLGGRLGDFVEGLIKPSVVRLFQERGIAVHVVTRNVEANNPELGLAMQIDLLVINSDSCILIEVKSNLGIDDVNEHLERMGKFKPLFPEYAHKKVYGAVAGMVIGENVAKFAYRKGFFVIAQKGETAIILNDEHFQPTAW